MNEFSVTRRKFLGTVAAVAAPSVLPPSLFGRTQAQGSLGKVDAFWARYFGCSTQDLSTARTLVVPHKALAGYDGVLVFRHDASCIVSVPDLVPEIERAKLRSATPEEACDPRFLSGVFMVGAGRVRGPLGLRIADRSAFSPVKSRARLLSKNDRPAIMSLARRCGEGAWVQSQIFPLRCLVFGLFGGRDLVAVAGYIPVEGTIAYIGSLVHPDHRGKGLARTVINKAMADAYEKGLVPAWRMLLANERAVELGRSLGFKPYAVTMDVQLNEDEF